MRCPKCGHNQQRKNGMSCSNCHYRFVIDPKETKYRSLTDGKFIAAINKASANGTRYFTENQLYAVICKQSARSSKIIRIVIFVIICGISLFFLPFKISLVFILALGFIFFFVFHAGSFYKPLSKENFQPLIRKWQAGALKSDKLLGKPSFINAPSAYPEKDIFDYGVESVLIVDKDLLVDLLVKNDWHAENRTLVVSINRYPGYIWSRMVKLLEESKRIPVYFLHDPSPIGVNLKSRFTARYPQLAEGRTLFDFGLHPESLGKIKARDWLGKDGGVQHFSVDYLLSAQLLGFLSLAVANPQTFGQWFRDQISNDSLSNFG